MLRQEGRCFFPGFREFDYKIDGLRGRLSYKVQKFISTDSAVDPFRDLMNAHRQDLEPLDDREVRDVARALERQTKALDEECYKGALFWFCPYSHTAVVNWGKLTPERERELEEETDWLHNTRPEPGQQRGMRYRYERYLADEVDEEPHVRFLTQWPQLGCWQVTAFPQAVAWLTQWVRNSQREIDALQPEWDEHPRLKERISELVRTHFKTVHRKEYLGEVPCMKHTLPPPKPEHRFIPRDRFGRPLYPEFRIPDDKQQWYDPVEELDQTHADRRLELANELVNLPPFTFYCRTTTAQQHVAMCPPVTAIIDETRIEEIRRTSKARFGRQTAPPVPPPPGSPAPSAGPRITREHPDEE